jgi:putative lipoprotein
MLKKSLVAISLACVCSLFMAPTQVLGSDGYISTSEYFIGGTQPGAFEANVLQSLGEPTERYMGDYTYTKGGPFVKYTNQEILFYNGIGLTVADISVGSNNYGRRVALILLLDRSGTTPSGLAVGDSIQKVIELYGLPMGSARNWKVDKSTRFGPYKFMYDEIYSYRVKAARTSWDDMEEMDVYTYKGRITAICLYTGY